MIADTEPTIARLTITPTSSQISLANLTQIVAYSQYRGSWHSDQPVNVPLHPTAPNYFKRNSIS